MIKRLILYFLVLSLCVSAVPLFASSAQAAYADEDWRQLIDRYRESFCGDASVDWEDPEIRKIVGVTNATGISTSGIGYNGGKYWLDLENNRQNPNRVFGNQDITIHISSDTMRKQLIYLCYMARAYGTPGASYSYLDGSGTLQTIQLYQNPELRSAIFYGLGKSMTFFNYEAWDKQHTGHDSTTNYNWWDWTYGGQKEILEALIILTPFQSTEEQAICDKMTATCLKLLDAIRPNNTGKTDNTSIGYRRVRLGVSPMIAALTKNTALMEESLTNLVDFLEDDPSKRDGVKSDYSYICHYYYPMEGTYGTDVLGNRIIGAYSVLAGTAFEPTTELRKNQFRWIMETFRPVIHNGVLLAMNSGRFPNSGRSYAVDALKAALRLVGCFGPAEDLQLKQFIRSMVVQDTEANTRKAYSSFAVSLGEVNLVQTLKEIVIDSTIPPASEEYAHMRYATDRAVQHRENYTVGISMSSNRIGPYECVNGCNRYGWYTGDGMVYVYNDTTKYSYDQYGETFQRFANMYRVPGTTEEDATLRLPWSERAPYFTGMTYTHNEAEGKDDWKQDYDEDGTKSCSFVGGAELNQKYIAAAMEFEAYSWTEEESRQELIKIHNSAQPDEFAERNKMKQVLVSDLSAKKSYFLFDDEIVCVGSDIDFSTRNNGVNTYVDNRELRETSVAGGKTVYGTDDILVDGTLLEKPNSFTAPKSYTDPTWIHAENFGGYYFPTGGQVYVNKTFRQSSNDGDNTNDDYNQINLTHNPTNGSHSFYELWISHGEAPQNGTYSYVMLPEKTPEETKAYTVNPDVKVLASTEALHVVREETLGITAMVFWKAGSYGGITVDQPMILMVQESNGVYELSVSDPTQELKSGTITIQKALHLTFGDPELTVTGSDKTVIKADFSETLGKSLAASFSVGKEETVLFDFADGREYESGAYSFTDYSLAKNWTVSGSAPTISKGTLALPLSSTGTTELTAGKLNLTSPGTRTLQIRLKVSGSTASNGEIMYSYLTDTWSTEATLCTLSQTCLQGELATYSTCLTLPDKTVKGLKIRFTGLIGGTATIDHISLGKEPENLYFGFDRDKAALSYLTGTYGGYDYLDTAWATNLSAKTGQFYAIEDGHLTVYGTDEYNGTAGTDQGIYVETTAKVGLYPWSTRDRHALSYDPEKAEILEIRFKTEDLAATPGNTPRLVLLYTRETDGVVSRNDKLSIPFSIQNGVYQTLRIPVDETFKDSDFIKSLGVRFRFTKSVDEISVGKISIDYLYVGSRKDAPSSLYFDFEASERYDRSTYGAIDYSQGNWSYSSNRLSAPVYEKGTVSMEMEKDPANGSLYLQVGPYLTQKFPLHFDISQSEVIQLRFKLENFTVSTNAKVGLYYYTTLNSHANGKDQIRQLLDSPLTEAHVNGEYVTFTFPVTEGMRSLEEIRSLRISFSGLGLGTETGKITVDHLYIGSYDLVPMQDSLFFDFEKGQEDLLRYYHEVYGYTNFDLADNWWTNLSYASEPTVEKGILTFASANAEGRTNHYVHSGRTHNVLPLAFVPGKEDVCQIRFSVENALCSHASGLAAFQLYYGVGSNATAGYDQVEFLLSDYVDEGYVTMTFPMDSSGYLSAGTITSLRFQFARITSAEGANATFHIDYLYVGPMEKAPAREKNLFIDFTNTPADQVRYEDKLYGEKNLDLASAWWTNSKNDQEPVVEDGALVLTSAQDSASTIHYALSCETFGAYPLQYTPKEGDLCRMRIRLENGMATESHGNLRLSMIYGVKDNNSAGFDYVELPVSEYMDKGWFTVTFPMDSGNYLSAPQIVSIRPQASYVTGKEGEPFRFLIDYIYIGTEEELPASTNYYLADFDNSKASQERYTDRLYGGLNPDLPESWWTNSTYATAPVVENGTMTLYSKEDTRTDHYFHSGPAHDVYPLAYTPGDGDYCQVRLKIQNAASTKADGTARFNLYFGIGETAVVASGNKDFSLSEQGNGEYFVLTFPMKHSKYLSAHEISCIRPQLSYAKNAEGENLSLTLDYLYLGPKDHLPLPLYTVTFCNEDGTVLEVREVQKGESVAYAGSAPVKAYDAQCHYSFKGWDKPLTNIQADTTIAAQFTATAHSYTYTKVDNTNHKGTCSCGYSETSAHGWNSGSITTQPTCTAGGVKTYICSACKGTRTEAVAAKGHTEVVDKAVAATCTAAGKTEGKHCSACSAVLVAQHTVPATGHSYIYAKIDALTHRVTCKNCDLSMETAHSYKDGFCSCGEPEVKEPMENSKLKLSHSLNLASDISVNLAVSKPSLTGFDMDTVYVESAIDIYEGNEKIGTTTIRIEPVESEYYYYFTLNGLTAVQMNDTITSTLYGTKDGRTYCSPVDVYSIATYAYSQLNKTTVADSLKTLCADLLRYGAKAQTYKSYRTDSLADAGMTAAHRAHLSDIDSVTFGNTNKVLNDLENAPISWSGKALNLESKVALKFVFNPANYQGDLSTLTLKVSYTDINGELKTLSVGNPELYNPDMGLYIFTLDALLAAELRSVVSVQIFAGDIPVSCTLQYSADTYGNNKTGNLLELCRALFAYSDSAKAYFQ